MAITTGDGPTAVRGVDRERVSLPAALPRCNHTVREPDHSTTSPIIVDNVRTRTEYHLILPRSRLACTAVRASCRVESVAEGGTTYYPLGLVEVDPATLVADEPVQRKPTILGLALNGKPTR